MSERDNIRAALSFIPAYDRDIWLRIGMAIKSELGDDGYSLWAGWSEQDPSWNEQDGRTVLQSIKPHGRVTVGTLFYEAKRHGFKFNGEYRPNNGSTPEDKTRRKDETGQAEADEAEVKQRRAQATSKATTIWKVSQPLAPDHSYLVRKQIKPASTLR